MDIKINWELFKEDFRALTVENRNMVWNYVKRLKRIQDEPQLGNDYGYLKDFKEETRNFIIRVDMEEGLNLYHSISSFVGNRMDKSSDKILEEYMAKYENKRPYLKENLEIVKDLIEEKYKKIKKRGNNKWK